MLNHTFSSRRCDLVKLAFSLLLWLFTCQQGHAEVLEDLYRAEVLVRDDSAAQLRTGARAGLLQVLVRVSGTTDVEQSSLVRSSLGNPSDYYSQYSYESSDRTLLQDGKEVPARLLRLRFDPSAVARLLRDAGLPVWGSNRPTVLLWIAVNDTGGRRILSEADSAVLVESLKDQATQRGLPLIFPILDLEDTSTISTAEVWGAFADRIEAASRRYGPDVILTARVQHEAADRWSLRSAYHAGEHWQIRDDAAVSADELLRDMIDALADNLADRFALGSTRGTVTLVVEGVSTLSAYASLSAYLEQLSPVLGSNLVALDGDVAEFRLQTEGQYSQLVALIEQRGRLLLLGEDQDSQRLRYRWSK